MLLLSSGALAQAEKQKSPASAGGVTRSSTTTLTSKAISASGNTLANLPGTALKYAVTAAETAANLKPVSLNYPVGNAWRYLSVAQISDAVARTLKLDVAAALNNGIKAAWANGVADYIPGGAYSISAPLDLPGVSTENRGMAFIMYGDGSGPAFSAAPFTNATDIVASGSNMALHGHQYLGAGTASPSMIIRNIRFEANNTTSVSHFAVFSNSTIDHCDFLQSGPGDGLSFDWIFYSTIRDTNAMNSGKVTVGGTKTGTGIYLIDSAADGGLTKIEHSLSAGWLNAYRIGNGSNPQEDADIESSSAQAASNGVVISAQSNKTLINNFYSENISGTVIQDHGNSTTVRDSFFFPGFTIGIDGSDTGNIGSSLYEGNVFEMGVANAFGIKASGAAGLTPNSVGIKDNSFYYSGKLSNVVGVKIAGSSPLIQMEGNAFFPGTAWPGSGSYQVVDSSTALGVIGKTVDVGVYYSFPLLANSGLQLSYTGNRVTASSVSAGVMALPVESIIYIDEPSTPTTVSSFAPTRPRIVVLYLNNSNITVVSSAYNTLSAPFNSTHGTLTLWLRNIGGQMYAYELARMEHPTAPTISIGFGTSPSIQTNSGAKSFSVNVGTGGKAISGVIGLPTAPHGWACNAHDNTTPAHNVEDVVTTTTTATIMNFSRTTGIAAAWAASDVLEVGCMPN